VLIREKQWHAAMTAAAADPPMQLLAGCRSELRESVHSLSRKSLAVRLRVWISSLAPISWSPGLAALCFALGLSFLGGRWFERGVLPGFSNGAAAEGPAEMGVLGPPSVRVRYVQPEGDRRVRLVVDQVREQVLTGAPDEEAMRRLLIAAAGDPSDPGLRVDSIEALKEQSGTDVVGVLLRAAENDPNAGVRLKAINGLRRFAGDSAVQTVLASVLEHDRNPSVRSEAIDALVPYGGEGGLDPAVSSTLGQLARSGQDDYIRRRCVQALKELKPVAFVY
jgi:hypothetical protein